MKNQKNQFQRHHQILNVLFVDNKLIVREIMQE